ncbi:winged helix-turn-helix domain-containing protein [Methanopyrus sp.]
MECRVKVFICADGRPVMGPGRYALLKAISEEGTVKKAAERLGWSYGYARRSIEALERTFGRKVVRTERGGPEGGRASLTDFGRKLVEEYERAVKEVREKDLKPIL